MTRRKDSAAIAISVLALLLVPAPAFGVLDNVVTKWTYITQQVVRVLPGSTNQLSARLYSQVSLAQLQAIKTSDSPEYRNKAHPDLAAAYAAHAILSRQHPEQQSSLLDSPLLVDVAAAGVTEDKRKVSEFIGVDAAVKLLLISVADESGSVSYFVPAPVGSNNGKYEWVPGQTYQLYPQLANSSTFVYPKDALLKLVEPYLTAAYAKDSPKFLAEKNWVRDWGGNHSTHRTQYQSDTAKFFLGGAPQGASGVLGLAQNISLSLLPPQWSTRKTAEYFASLNTAGYDATIAVWNLRQRAPRWRPITAVRFYDDPTWSPLLPTPYHPEYPSAHQAVFGSFYGVLLEFLGGNTLLNEPLKVYTEWPGIPPRTYTDLTVLAQEAAESRVFAGAHYNQSTHDSFAIGSVIGKYNYGNINNKLVYGTFGVFSEEL